MATLPNPLPRLATDPSGRSLGLQLPPGRLVDETDDGPWHEPLLWLADKPAAPGAWKVLGAPARRVGLLPVLVDVGGAMSGPERWELGPGLVSYPGDHDAEEVLAEYWAEEMEEGGGEFGGDWTGLAPRASPRRRSRHPGRPGRRRPGGRYASVAEGAPPRPGPGPPVRRHTGGDRLDRPAQLRG